MTGPSDLSPGEQRPIGYAPPPALLDEVDTEPNQTPPAPPKRRSKLLWTFLIIGIVIVSMFVGGIVFGGPSSAPPGGPGGGPGVRQSRTGTGATVEIGPIQRSIEVDGSIQPVATYALTFPTPSSDVVVGPRILTINTSVGQRVQAGWLLARLEGDDVDSAKIFAPIDGVITEVKGVAGAPPPSGATISMRSNDLQGQFPLSESDLATLKLDTEATVTIPVLSRSIGATIKSLPEDPAAAQSTTSGSSSSSSNSASSAVTYNLLVPMPAVAGLRPGLTARIAAITYSNPTAILVPSGAVTVDGTGTFVTLSARDGEQPRRRDIRIGNSDGRRTEVLEGLKPGDTVVIRPQTPQGG